jgi:hypothetical protein
MLSDQDYEILEMYLDDALSQTEVEALRTRMASDATLTIALSEIRNARRLRAQWIQSLEPSAAEVESLVSAVRRDVMRDTVWSSRLAATRRWTAIAATFAIVFAAGWFGRDFTRTDSAVPGSPLMTSTPTDGQIVFDSRPLDGIYQGNARPASNTPRTGGYYVQLTDDYGRVIGVQRFQTLDEARRFTDDLDRWQTRQRNLRSGGDTVLIKDDF